MDRAQPKLVAGFGPVGHQLQEHLHRRGRGLPSGDGGGTLRASGWPPRWPPPSTPCSSAIPDAGAGRTCSRLLTKRSLT